MFEPECSVVAAADDAPWLMERTWRSLGGTGSPRLAAPANSPSAQGRWLVAAGAWTWRRPSAVPEHPQAWALIGATLNEAWQPLDDWKTWLKRTGGIATEAPPPAHSLYLSPAATELAATLAWTSIDALVQQLLARQVRIIRHAPLDVRQDRSLRVLEVITSLQRGGAERLALELHQALPSQGVASSLCVLGSPTRSAFAAPPATLSLSHLPFDPLARAGGISHAAACTGSDLIHAHLIEGDTAAALVGEGWPLLITLHNERAGWQSGFDAALPGASQICFAACSAAVASDARQAMPEAQVRIAWNGIHASQFQAGNRQAWRAQLGVEEPCLVFLVLANPRPQKRVALAARIFVEWQRGHPDCKAFLVLAGEPSAIDERAAGELAQFWQVVDEHQQRSRVRAVGTVADIAGLLAACDVLLSPSAHEGMSLAQMEAIAAGLRLVVSDAGGSTELAAEHEAVVVVPKDAAVPVFVAAVEEALRRKPSPLARDFSLQAMAQRYRWLFRLHLRRRQAQRRGLLLITNNFSTGGAQSSARRLLLGLQQAGVSVRAATLQEWPDHPTPGRRALVEAGIPVIAVLPPEAVDATLALPCLLEEADRQPPEAVLFWNVMPDAKVLLAEAFDDVPVFDVSPGEMFFDSLRRYFARPRPGSPYRSLQAYAALLAGVVVKHTQEEAIARQLFDLPVHVIANGVDLPLALVRQPHTGLLIGTAARLYPHKRLEDLLEAFHLVHAQRSDVQLLVAGGEEEGLGAYAAQLRAAARELPVRWLGDVADMTAFHAELDVFVMISEPVGCPNASLEAMAAGLPVVATAVGGACDQIVDGDCGLLTPPRDAHALARALLRLLDDALLRERLGSSARVRIQTAFSLPSMISGYLQLLPADLGSRSSRPLPAGHSA